MGFLKFIDKKLDDLNDAVERFGDKVDEYSDGIDELTEQYKDLSTDELLKIAIRTAIPLTSSRSVQLPPKR